MEIATTIVFLITCMICVITTFINSRIIKDLVQFQKDQTTINQRQFNILNNIVNRNSDNKESDRELKKLLEELTHPNDSYNKDT